MAAYRYPEDYDAISAMAPANPMTGLMVQTMWTGFQALRTPQSRLSPATLGLVHKAAVAQCDALDGLEDGLISRPDQCRFDPVALQCKPGESSTCLAPAQVEALHGIYGGVRDRSGTLLLPGFPFGSEMQLAAIISGEEPFPVATSYFRNFIHAGQPDWDWRTMDYARDLAAARAHGESLFDVPPDGLDAFFARGGKLLLSHGWSDGLIPATNTLQFYYDLYHAVPQQAAQTQLRLFMAPGMDHCSGGNGPSQFDTLGVIDEWASGGAAPGRIIATRAAPAPGAPALPAISRPLCAYPLVARYNGRGSTAEAENFTCVIPD
jgi:hypothetical protein